MDISTTYRYTYFFLFAFFTFGCQSASSSHSLFDKEVIDLGQVTNGGKVDFKVGVKNPADEPIKLVDVEGTCGCITVKTYPKSLEAGQDGTINATYDTKFDLSAKGVIYKNIVVKLDKKPYLHSVKVKVDLK